MMTGLKWGTPEAFYLLVVLVLWVVFSLSNDLYFQKKLQKIFGPKVLPWLTSSISFQRRKIKIILLFLSQLFFILALARPQVGQSEQEIKSEGIELMILADVSESMLAEDVKPSRLEQMKIELSKLIDLMPGNKTGLIAFAGSAALMSPLTTDPGGLKMYIESLDTYAVSTQGTAVELALNYALEAFEKGGVTQSQDLKTTRVIILASDGEDHEQGALEAAKKLAEQGVQIITLAYGTERGATIPTRDPFGNLRGPKKDNSGQIIMTQVKGDFLKSIANTASESGSGHFYFADVDGSHLRQIAKDIDQFDKAQFASSTLTQYDEKYTYPLVVGLVFLILALVLSDRKSVEPIWKGRYEYE